MPEDFSRYRYKDRQPAVARARRLLWEAVCLLLFRPTPRWAFNSWRCTLLRMFGAQIGRGCRIAPSCRIWAPWNLTLGDFTALAEGVDCYCVAPIRIGSKVTVSQRAFLCTASHDVRSLLRPLESRSITIGDHVWIAAEAFLLPGVCIGDGSIIAARSLVTHDMPKWWICAGHPAKPLKPRELEQD
jgi:putative colanic acid biosynthesis acetyltransferase WcaF